MSPLIKRLILLTRTVRYLKPIQVIFRPLRSLQSRLPVTPTRGSAVWDRDGIVALRAMLDDWHAGDLPERVRRADELLEGWITHLSVRRSLASIDWGGRHVSHLWTYQHQSCGIVLDLAWAFRASKDEKYLDSLMQFVRGWIKATGGQRGDAWAPYPMSVRIANWTFALGMTWQDLPAPFREEMGTSLHSQLGILSRRLEYHLQANHLQKNYHALLVGATLFDTGSSRHWRRTGLRGMETALRADVLADGGHGERSPMYHAIAMSDFLEVACILNALGVRLNPIWTEKLRLMVEAFGVLCRPGGTIHQFNDAVNSSAPSWQYLDHLARRAIGSGLPSPRGRVALDQTGYYGFVAPNRGVRFIFDAGPPGPSYQLGHAHCDLLSYELDWGGHPIVVDSGVCGYAEDPMREYVRSVRAHNTVEIDGKDQHEMWGSFRVARRAALSSVTVTGDEETYAVSGSYAPFHDRRASHERSIEVRRDGWTVTDRVDGATGKQLRSFVHFHPSLSVFASERIIVKRGSRAVFEVSPFGMDWVSVIVGRTSPVQGWWCPEFGKALPAPVVEMGVRMNRNEPFGYGVTPLMDL